MPKKRKVEIPSTRKTTFGRDAPPEPTAAELFLVIVTVLIGALLVAVCVDLARFYIYEVPGIFFGIVHYADIPGGRDHSEI
jgi:hypothetical protein